LKLLCVNPDFVGLCLKALNYTVDGFTVFVAMTDKDIHGCYEDTMVPITAT
jgi:hypothetical protein